MYRNETRLFVVSSVCIGPRLFVGSTLPQLDSLSLQVLCFVVNGLYELHNLSDTTRPGPLLMTIQTAF
jgi:hypothetical protein